MDKQRKSETTEPRAPQLGRVVLLKLQVEHQSNGSVTKLASKLRRESEIILLPPSPTQVRCRVAVRLRFNGTWTEEGATEPVVSFAAEYEGRFSFSEDVPLASVEKWMASKFYSDSIIAQAYPVANAHMYAQLGMTGLYPRSRNLGFVPELAEEVPVSPRKRKRGPNISAPKGIRKPSK